MKQEKEYIFRLLSEAGMWVLPTSNLLLGNFVEEKNYLDNQIKGCDVILCYNYCFTLNN
jgi:hypothetical protein